MALLMRRSGAGSLHCHCHFCCLYRKWKQVKFHYSSLPLAAIFTDRADPKLDFSTFSGTCKDSWKCNAILSDCTKGNGIKNYVWGITKLSHIEACAAHSYVLHIFHIRRRHVHANNRCVPGLDIILLLEFWSLVKKHNSQQTASLNNDVIAHNNLSV